MVRKRKAKRKSVSHISMPVYIPIAEAKLFYKIKELLKSDVALMAEMSPRYHGDPSVFSVAVRKLLKAYYQKHENKMTQEMADKAQKKYDMFMRNKREAEITKNFIVRNTE